MSDMEKMIAEHDESLLKCAFFDYSEWLKETYGLNAHVEEYLKDTKTEENLYIIVASGYFTDEKLNMWSKVQEAFSNVEQAVTYLEDTVKATYNKNIEAWELGDPDSEPLSYMMFELIEYAKVKKMEPLPLIKTVEDMPIYKLGLSGATEYALYSANINMASDLLRFAHEDDLTKIKGVGPARARKIMEARNRWLAR